MASDDQMPSGGCNQGGGLPDPPNPQNPPVLNAGEDRSCHIPRSTQNHPFQNSVVATSKGSSRPQPDETREQSTANQTNEQGNQKIPHPRAEANLTEQIEVTDDEEAEENVIWTEEYEREREIEVIKASPAKAEADMKFVKSQMHSVASSTPNIDRILEESRNTPFTRRISEVTITDPEKLKIEYFNGTSDPKVHIKSFMIAVARARFKPGEKDVGLCLLFVEHLKRPALDWFSRLDQNSVNSF
ncbi:hypothetical protein ISN44_As06g035070 [Arabidopsis suecica]|uniref:Retrotransposon gag domain-containing protein n=1 Tax=Arabidopsis suecica TaxID=45249 RepID=A0A8T2CM36_ARASU|nr:hypothetical protein ISN44_As06g035070 [Arabidopsis suecica]